MVMKRNGTVAILVLALAAPLPAAADGTDNMFGLMFRMMLTMMNVMSGAMLGNNNNSLNNNSLGNNNWMNNFSNGLGGMNSFNLGMTALPMMSGFGSPWNSFGGTPWNSFGGATPWNSLGGGTPWNSFGSMPWNGLGGVSPWSSYGGAPMGVSPWNGPGGSPWSNPWSSGRGNPFGSYPGEGYPRAGGPGWGNNGYPANYGAHPPANYSGNDSLIGGRWYGSSGEILEVRGNRFHLQAGNVGLDGVVEINNDIISMYSPQTNTVTRYAFVRNQTGLLLQGENGEVLQFTQNPVNGIVHVF
jgi:hypothetical protein